VATVLWIFDLTFYYKTYVLVIALTANLVDVRSWLDIAMIASPVMGHIDENQLHKLNRSVLSRCSSRRGRHNWLRLISLDFQ